MRILGLVLVVLLPGCDAIVQASLRNDPNSGFSRALDEKNGFRDLQWGARPESIPGLQGSMRENEDLELGAAHLESIRYLFQDAGGLSTVILTTRGFINSQALLDALKAHFGHGSQDNPYIPTYEWFGDKTCVRYERNLATDDAQAIFTSAEAMKRNREYRQSRGASANF